MDITLTTPAIMFPAITLMMLVYTNRFLGLASLIRGLHQRYEADNDPRVREQIDNLNRRVELLRSMQGFSMGALLCFVLCIFALFLGWQIPGKALFTVGLVLLTASLSQSLREIRISCNALKIQLGDMAKK
ncbi:DUF2721 domain-containing protein [Desulfovibrio ferrophilus]|uniref:Putative membrane protein n=1 Tax=Desulfovibrio ferrophilus TaxID=241368 RepID=A0A2Z6B1Z1_9BACT|nr:DUF2721 domain-containing protein [Desulfovibrio ferrophilus]BBD09416.1 putative membrane protein [Desulfovibrio ferrophilus]